MKKKAGNKFMEQKNLCLCFEVEEKPREMSTTGSKVNAKHF